MQASASGQNMWDISNAVNSLRSLNFILSLPTSPLLLMSHCRPHLVGIRTGERQSIPETQLEGRPARVSNEIVSKLRTEHSQDGK